MGYPWGEARIRWLEKLLREGEAAIRTLQQQVARLTDDANQQRPPAGGGGGPGWIGQTTVAVPALYGSAGMVNLCTLALASPTDADPTYTDLQVDPVKAYNGTGGAIPAGKNCGGYFVGAFRVISWANCTNPGTPDPAPLAPPQAMTTDNDTFMTDGTSDDPMMTA